MQDIPLDIIVYSASLGHKSTKHNIVDMIQQH